MNVKVPSYADGVGSILRVENYRMRLCVLCAAFEVSKRKISTNQLREITNKFTRRCEEFGADTTCGAADSILLDECRSCGFPAFDPVMEERLLRIEQEGWKQEQSGVRQHQSPATHVSLTDQVRITDYRITLVMFLVIHDVLGFGAVKRLPEVYRMATELRRQDLEHQYYGIYPQWLFDECKKRQVEATSDSLDVTIRRLCRQTSQAIQLHHPRQKPRRTPTAPADIAEAISKMPKPEELYAPGLRAAMIGGTKV